jgi:hypothetical protein
LRRVVCFHCVHVRRVVLSLQLLAVAIGLTACGSDALALDPVASAAEKTVESGSSRVAFTASMKLGSDSVDMTGSGAFDYQKARGQATYSMQVPMFGEVGMDMRILGSKVFIRLPEALAGAGLTGGKEWMGMDVKTSLEQAGLGGLDFSQQQDPAQMLQYLRAASTGVGEAGSATVRGVETTRYTGRLDFRKAVDAGIEKLELTPAERERARQGMAAMLDQLGGEGVPFEVFVDEDGLLRRLTMDMNMAIEGDRRSMHMQMDYFDFGVDVNVQAPPARDVFDATGMLRP